LLIWLSYSHRREYTHPQNPDARGLNLELTTYTYDVKYNYDIAKTVRNFCGINGMFQNNALGYSTDSHTPKRVLTWEHSSCPKESRELDLSGE